MIKFKQKEYVLPILGAAGKMLAGAVTPVLVGTSLWGVKQGADANKQQEEANEQAAREQRRHNKAMEEAARENPGTIQKDFAAIPGSIMKNATGFAKDLFRTQKGNLKHAAGLATSIAGTTYLGNRLATSIKDHQENNDEGNKNFLKKAALTTAAVGGSILAAKRGGLGKPIQNFMTTGKGGKALSALGKAVNPIVRDEAGKISAGRTLQKNAINGIFVAMPTVSYLAQKKSASDMADNTQREYSVLGLVKSGLNATKQGIKSFKAHPGLSTTSGVNHVASFFGMYGNGGTGAVQKTVSNLAKAGQQSGNAWTQKTAEFLGKHKKTANLLATGGTVAVGAGVMKAGNATIEKPMRAIDNDAYKMEDKENDKI